MAATHPVITETFIFKFTTTISAKFN